MAGKVYVKDCGDVQQEGDIGCQIDDTKKNFMAYNGLKYLRIHTHQEFPSITFQCNQHSRNTSEMQVEQYITPEPFKVSSCY